MAHLAPPSGLVIEVDGNTGEIVSSLHSTNGAVRFISEAYIHDRYQAVMLHFLVIEYEESLGGYTSVLRTQIIWREYQRD